MNKFINSHSLIFLIVVVVVFYLGSSYMQTGSEQSPESTPVAGTSEQAYAPPNTIAKQTGPQGAYDPHAALTPEKHIQVALQHKQEGRVSEALRTLTMAILQHAENADLYAVRGSIHLEQGEAAAALSDLEKAVKIAPDNSELLTNRAQVYRQFGQIQQALADLDRAIELNPDLVAARFNRGAIHYSSEEFAKALLDFDHCVTIDPHAAAPYFNRASTRHALGDIAGAKADLNRFIQLSDNEQWKSTARDLLQRWDNADDSTEGPET